MSYFEGTIAFMAAKPIEVAASGTTVAVGLVEFIGSALDTASIGLAELNMTTIVGMVVNTIGSSHEFEPFEFAA